MVTAAYKNQEFWLDTKWVQIRVSHHKMLVLHNLASWYAFTCFRFDVEFLVIWWHKNGCLENCAYVWVHSTAVFMVAMLISMEITVAFSFTTVRQDWKKHWYFMSFTSHHSTMVSAWKFELDSPLKRVFFIFYDFYITSQH